MWSLQEHVVQETSLLKKSGLDRNTVSEMSFFREEKRILSLCLINLFRFCPAATITPSIFTLNRRLRRNRLTGEILLLPRTKARPTYSVCAWPFGMLPFVYKPLPYRDTPGRMIGKYTFRFCFQCIPLLLDKHYTLLLWVYKAELARTFVEK